MKAVIVEDAALPQGYGGWLDYYFRKSGADTRLLYCAVYGCPTPPDGAAPMTPLSGGRFVVPLCSAHRDCHGELELYDFELTAALE